MVFTSVVFLFFFMPLSLLYHVLPKNIKLRNLYLLAISLLFYIYGEGKNVILMLIAILTSHIGSVLISRYPNRKKPILIISVSIMLSQLFIFKYLGFATEILSGFTNIKPVDIVMPIGISFFTFQAISYLVDVYRGDSPARNVFDAALYVSLFPQLVAGPIVRYDTVAKELKSRTVSLDGFSYGLDRFLIGFSMKMLLSNPFGKIADAAFNLNMSGSLYFQMALIGGIAYTLHIYYDFAAYSHMAIGMGKMFGFNFLENFNYPYISKNIKEFWRRWHISLSSYFRDYVYIPLGGNRCSKTRNIFNLLVVWFLTGLWHGAGYTFIVWGLYNFMLLMIERYVFKDKFKSHIVTMALVVIGWIIFRAESMGLALNYFKSFLNFTIPEGRTWLYYILQNKLEWIFGILLISPWAGKMLDKNKFIKRALLLILFIVSVLRLFTDSFNPFIYFRF
ncbi:MAG: MBOAT family O-acyltransferase [Ezakiella sp.]|nr:MBOAT family protein [Bacillota bacterium]MDY3947117.1 MBOAT family O-acyltransferase [Ezakiella sp.]